MPRAFRPSILTANDLLTGEVVYLAPDDTWTRNIAGARLLEDADSAQNLLSRAVAREGEIVSPLLAPIDPVTRLPLATRERIRAQSPFTLPRARKPDQRTEPRDVSA